MLDDTLNAQSGLLGISGVSSDMREIAAVIKQGNEQAKLGFDIFGHSMSWCLRRVPNPLARTRPFLANASIHDVGSENHRNRSRYFLI